MTTCVPAAGPWARNDFVAIDSIDFDLLAHVLQRLGIGEGPGVAFGVVEQSGIRHDLLLRSVHIDVLDVGRLNVDAFRRFFVPA